MFKRFCLILISVFCVLSFTAQAASDITVEPGDGFYVYGSDSSAVAEILGFSEEKLEEYRATEGIAYIAVNSDNSKQIKITGAVTDFSSSVVNITGLSDDKITELIPEITGIESVKGEIIVKNGQKFIKTVLASSDSGGDYLLTEYITVADRTLYTLSFYTSASQDSAYTQTVFETLSCSAFINSSDGGDNAVYYIIAAAALLFAVFAVGIAVWIAVDIAKEKRRNTGEETTEESDDKAEALPTE